MSLLVWLPLSGNFNNNGVAYVDPFTMPSGGSWSAGRVGNNLTIANGGIGKTCSKLNGLTTFSISLWYRTTASKTFTQWSDIVSISSSSQFRLETCNTSGTQTNWFGLGLSSGGTTNQTVTAGTWYHDVVTVNGAIFKRYINGNLIGTVTAGSTVALTNTLTLGNGGMYCQMADLRIYDNILSDKEIKEIYKYKVLHWPLNNRGYDFINPNLIKNTANGSGWSCSSFSRPEKTFTRSTTATTESFIQYRADLTAGTTYTFSGEVKTNGQVSNVALFAYDSTVKDVKSKSVGAPTEWTKVFLTFTPSTSYNWTNCYIRFDNDGSKTSGTEASSVVTPWCPNTADPEYAYMGYNDTKEYDASGYLRHGNLVSAMPTIEADSPKYNCSYKYTGSVNNVHYNNTTDLNFTDNFSWAIWVKTNYTGTTAQYIFTVGRADAGGYGYGLQCASASQCNIKYGNASWALAVTGGTWTHIAFTKSGNTCKIYKNGVLASTQTFSGTAPTFSDGNGVGIGCFHYSSNIYPYYGNASDFRIYANTLTDNDIKDIYNGISIDNAGNVYAFDFSEK